MRRNGLVLSALFASTTIVATARADGEPVRTRLGAEIDPFPFFAHGFSVHLELKPTDRFRATIGAFGSRASPDSGGNAGFTREGRALETSIQYFVLPWSGGGLFGGLYVFFQHYDYSRIDTPGSADAYWLTPAPAAGFQWLPWKKGPYVTPWAALGFPIRRGSREVGTRTFDEPALFPVLTLHIGYELDL